MTDYQQGHIKRDPTTGATAIRTHFPDDDAAFAEMAWLVATVNVGSKHVVTAAVDAWDDLYTPPAE